MLRRADAVLPMSIFGRIIRYIVVKLSQTIVRKNRLRVNYTPGFTIVELLIVIVVIAILAAITIVSFNGIQSRARESQIKNNLTSVYKILSIERVLTGLYPVSLAAADSGRGIIAGSDWTYQYSVNNTLSPRTFCVTYVRSGVAYFISELAKPETGTCPGHSANGAGAPLIASYHDFSTDVVAGAMNINPSSSIADASWMVVILAFTNDTFPTMPAGWSTLLPRSTIGTLRTSVFAKIKDASDTFPVQATFPTGSEVSVGVLFWGTGAAPVSSWVLGDRFGRDGTTTNQYTTITPALTTASQQNLILSVSTERTNLTETDVSSISGAAKWFFIPQVGSRIQTITIGSFVQAAAGATPTVTVTYPNPQTNNGQAFQLALPPAN